MFCDPDTDTYVTEQVHPRTRQASRPAFTFWEFNGNVVG
jgi:hypothetical protein